MVRLGKDTFSMYLLHDILILTVMSFVFVKLQPNIGYIPAAVVAFISLCIVLVPSTILFTKYIDSNSIKLSRQFAAKFRRSS